MFKKVWDFLVERAKEPGTKKGALAVVLWVLARFGLEGDADLVALADGALTVTLGAIVYATREKPKD